MALEPYSKSSILYFGPVHGLVFSAESTEASGTHAPTIPLNRAAVMRVARRCLQISQISHAQALTDHPTHNHMSNHRIRTQGHHEDTVPRTGALKRGVSPQQQQPLVGCDLRESILMTEGQGPEASCRSTRQSEVLQNSGGHSLCGMVCVSAPCADTFQNYGSCHSCHTHKQDGTIQRGVV